MAATSSRSARRGRALELLVKRIKEHQSPEAKINSPEFVPDKDTGQLREVDVGLHVVVGGKPLFIAIECRDRGAAQSVEWIEQLISKKNSISADVLVAVTSSKFSGPAKLKALRHGVLLARVTKKLPNELLKLTSSFFVTLEYLAPTIVRVELKIPEILTQDLENYRYRHKKIDRLLTLTELAEAWTTVDLVRTIPRYVTDWDKGKFVSIGLIDIDAEVLLGDQFWPIEGARISYELNHGDVALSLLAVQELSNLLPDVSSDATVFAFGSSGQDSEIIVDEKSGNLRWNVLEKNLLGEGKVLIGAELRASKPVSITTMQVEL